MPPDISLGTPLAAAPSLGRAAGPATGGPPGSDPLAALFASLLAGSASPIPPGAAAPTRKAANMPTTEPVNPAPDKAALDKPAEGKTTDKTNDKNFSAALSTLPLLLTPIQMRPSSPPTAGSLVEPKTMDTSPVPAPPAKEPAGVTPSGELPLPGDGTTPVLPVPFPALLIVPPAPPIHSGVNRVAASPDAQASQVSLSSAPSAAVPLVPDAAPTLPTVFTLGAVPVTQQPLVKGAASTETGTEPTSPAAGPASLAPAQTVSTTYLPTTQGYPVPTAAVLELTKPSVGDTAQGASPIPAPTAAGKMGQPLVPTLLPFATPLPAQAQEVAAASDVTATDGSAAKEGKSATDSKTATAGDTAREGMTATDGIGATESQVTTDGKTATDSKTATDGKTWAAGAASSAAAVPQDASKKDLRAEKGLKWAASPADTITRSQVDRTKALPEEMRLQVIGKRSEQRAVNAEDDAALALPLPVPAQAGSARVETKPLTPADRAEMVRQVADGVGAMPLPTKVGVSEQMTLQLHPKDWGQLQISVTVTPGMDSNAIQAVTAHIVAESPQVKAALENHSGDLRQALREAGLHLDRISVTVQSMDASAQAGTATSGGHHGGNQGGADQGRAAAAFGEAPPDQKTGTLDGTGMSGVSGNGMPSFAAHAGSQGGRQGGQPPAYAAAYAPAEPEREEGSLLGASRQTASGQVDIRA